MNLMANSFKVWESIFGALIMITASIVTRALREDEELLIAEFVCDSLLAIAFLLVFHCYVTRLGFESIEKVLLTEQN